MLSVDLARHEVEGVSGSGLYEEDHKLYELIGLGCRYPRLRGLIVSRDLAELRAGNQILQASSHPLSGWGGLAHSTSRLPCSVIPGSG